MSNEKKLLEVDDVSFYYKRGKPVIRGVSFSAAPGEIVGISGENGSGKSTLLKLIIGILKPKSGRVVTNGRLGYSPQNMLLFENLTVMENFSVFGKGMKMSTSSIESKASEIMDILKFSKYRDTLVKDLSGGTAQKLNFGISLLGDPDVLVLDEPYQGMDYASFQAFWELQFKLREQGKTVIIVSHMIEDQSKFSRSMHLVNGKLQGCNRVDCPECCGD